MEVDLDNVKLDRDDFNSLHDVILSASEYDIDVVTDEELIDYWKKIPDHIRYSALEWGIGDSVVRDDIYVWLKEEFKK